MAKKNHKNNQKGSQQIKDLNPDKMELVAATRIVSGLQEGLSEFAGPTKVAVLLATKPESTLLMLDPNNLLTEHTKQLQNCYEGSQAWRAASVPEKSPSGTYSDVNVVFNYHLIDLNNAIDLVARSRSVFHQHWFIEQHSQLGSTLPIIEWTEAAAVHLARDLAFKDRLNNSGSWSDLVNYSTTAVLQALYRWESKYIAQELRMALPHTTLQALLNLSKTLEEGKKASGKVVFVHEDEIEAYTSQATSFAKDNGLPSVANSKHLRKLLALTESSGCILSDGRSVTGVNTEMSLPPNNAIVAELNDGRGILFVGAEPICAFSDGKVKPYVSESNLTALDLLLTKRKLKPHWRQKLLQLMDRTVSYARQHHHGCTLFIDFRKHPERLRGEYFTTPVDSLAQIDLLMNAAGIDGAVHLDSLSRWYGFGCLLDGDAIESENRARGARYNSCLRFSAKKKEKDSILVVCSEDGYLNIIEKGKEFNEKPSLILPKFDQFSTLAE